MAVQYIEEETFVYVDFGKYVPLELFNRKCVFFKIVDLDTKCPLIQIGDNVFQGYFQDVPGTNVFFEEEEDSAENKTIFEKQTPIHLNYIMKQCAQIKMKRIKEPKKNRRKNETTPNYYTTLSRERKRLEALRRHLNGDKDDSSDSDEEKELKVNKDYTIFKLKKMEEVEFKEAEQLNLDLNKYKKLKGIAKQPLKFEVPWEEFLLTDEYRFNYYYRWLSCVFTQTPRQFNKFTTINLKSLKGSVDIKKSIEDGVIEPITYYKELTNDHRKALTHWSNYKNMSLPMRLLVILENIQKLKRYKNDDLCEFGFDVDECIKLLQYVSNDIKKSIDVLMLKQEDCKSTQ